MAMETVAFTLSEESMRGLEALRGDIARLMRMMTTAQMVPESGETLEANHKLYREEVARRVHGARGRAAMTLEALSEAVRLPIRMLEHIENGTFIHVGFTQLHPIAKALGVPASYLDPDRDDSGRIVNGDKSYTMGGYDRPLYPPRGSNDGKDEGQE